MPRKVLIGFTMMIWMLVAAEAARADSLTITLTNVHKSEGTVMIQVMASEEEFNGGAAAIASVMQRAAEGAMSYQIDVPAGTYGVRIMHDVNGNGELDANFVGIPSEPWGFSNNAAGNFGPPKWDDVKFDISGDTTQEITLNK